MLLTSSGKYFMHNQDKKKSQIIKNNRKTQQDNGIWLPLENGMDG